MKDTLKYFTALISLTLTLTSTAGSTELSEPLQNPDQVLIDFNQSETWGNWWIVNDDVMGGISQSALGYSGKGTAVFKGYLSLENYGGFASVRAQSPSFNAVDDHNGLRIRVRGDGKDYQLRLRTSNRFDGISYQYRFATKKDTWITVQAAFQKFTPVFRGRRLRNVPPISPQDIRQIGFMISDKQEGAFQLEIEWIKAYQ